MRERLRTEHLCFKKGEFDLKQGIGGIVDIEFLVQYLVLNHANDFPDIMDWTDNIRLLEGLSVEGIITGQESQILQEAYVGIRKVIHRLTLQEKPLMVEDTLFHDTVNAVAKIYNSRLKVESTQGQHS